MPLGGLIALLVLLPNLLVLFFPPMGEPPRAVKKGSLRAIEVIERMGQAGVFLIPFFYRLPALRSAEIDMLIVMGLSLGLYYSGWVRYMVKGRRFVLLFAPLLRIPIPMAVSPVVYFAAAAIFLHSWPLGVAVVLLAIGHLSVSREAWLRCQAAMLLPNPPAQTVRRNPAG